MPPPEEKFAKEIDMGGFLPDLFPRKGKEDEMGDIKAGFDFLIKCCFFNEHF